jgi:regulator of replication initiation timing
MTNKKTWLAVIALIICTTVFVFFSTSLMGREKTYEIRPEIRLTPQQTQYDRLINAYERLNDRYMKLADKNLTALNAKLTHIEKKIDSLDERTTLLTLKLDKLEKSLHAQRAKQKPKKTQPLKTKPDTEQKQEPQENIIQKP